jgi:UDP-2,3-diacylglucosamine pyrophosphatase LpxH
MHAPTEPAAPHRYRTIWLSDVHLGMHGSQTDRLLDFLRRHDADHLYIVGDLVDGWRLRKVWRWNQACNDVIQKLLRKARKGTRITYIPGNHDEFARAYIGCRLGQIDIARNALHQTADGRRLLVLHGDEFDGVIAYAKWLSVLGSNAYCAAMQINGVINAVRRRLGLPSWSLSAYLKNRVKDAVKSLADFERAIAEEARSHHADGVVCGHLHRPAIQNIQGIAYYNTGDWVESCTALVEHHNGSMEILHWTPEVKMPQCPVPDLQAARTPPSPRSPRQALRRLQGQPAEAPATP